MFNYKKLFLSVSFILTVYSFCYTNTYSQKIDTCTNSSSIINWTISELIKHSDRKVTIKGSPKSLETNQGSSVIFNGLSDGIFIDSLPIKALTYITIEAIIYPEEDGPVEQRFFHSGTIRGNRIMLETRTTSTHWYFDAFVKCNNKGLALVNPDLLHPLNCWYHVAFVIDDGHLSTYINGKLEIKDFIEFYPTLEGITSIGVRQNMVSWFKGKISEINIAPKALLPAEFIILNKLDLQ